MGKIFDDPCQQARQEMLESSEEIFKSEQEGGQEDLSMAESFHYLLCQDQPDPEWEEIHQKVLAGAMPSDY